MAIEWFMAQVQALRVLPLVTLDHPASGVDVAHALGSAGLTVMEVSLRTEGALDAIAEIARSVPDVLLGAGTVMRPEQVDAALAAGARFVGSPVVDPQVIRRAGRRQIPMIPGIENHADAIGAAREGARVARLALAPEIDGPAMVRCYARLFPTMQFIPAGAIAPVDIAGYLRERSVLAVASTRLTPHGASPEDMRRLAVAAVAAGA
jgi:2-dehydro-3-deoxyphosphogluconate aldolase / (4S)-4-hydroxy-2-oxoglutarate aldolase